MDFVTTPERVQLMASSAENFIRHFNVGRTFDMSGAVPRLGADVPRWFGESVAFWDGDTLITWTSNVIPWITHGVFEFSRQMQTVEIFSPRRDPAGKLAGIEHEIVFYDPEALAQPLRLIQVHIKTGNLSEVDPFVYGRCIQTIFPVNGRPQASEPGHDDRVHRAGHVRPPLGADLGALLRAGHEAAARRVDLRFLAFRSRAEKIDPRRS